MAQAIDSAPTAYDAAHAMLAAAAIAYTGDVTPKGCLLASATASGSAASADVQGAIADIRRSVEKGLLLGLIVMSWKACCRRKRKPQRLQDLS